MLEKAIITNSTLNDIGKAIIEKGGASSAILPSDMPAAIRSIETYTPTPEITGKSFDLSTEKGVTRALAIVLETFGGIVTAGKSQDMRKDAPVTVVKDAVPYSLDIYDDDQGIGLDISRVEESSNSSDSSSY